MPSREEILAMAKSAGFESYSPCLLDDELDIDYHDTVSMLERFFHLAYAAGQRDMQERAAKHLDDVEARYHDQWNDTRSSYYEGYRDCAGICAVAIRELK